VALDLVERKADWENLLARETFEHDAGQLRRKVGEVSNAMSVLVYQVESESLVVFVDLSLYEEAIQTLFNGHSPEFLDAAIEPQLAAV